MSWKEALRARKELRRRRQLTAAHEFLRSRAHSDEAKAELDHELERQLAETPKYHRGSKFTDPPKINTDRNFLNKVLVIARALENKSYKERAKGAHGGVLGRSALDVLELLINLARKRGKVAPGYQALAAMARKHRQTVMAAIEVLERWGFVTVIRRLKEIQTVLGRKVVQAACAFDIHPPELAGSQRPYSRVIGGDLLAAMMIPTILSKSKKFSPLRAPGFSQKQEGGKTIPISPRNSPLEAALAHFGRIVKGTS
jgi:hypothetical protein